MTSKFSGLGIAVDVPARMTILHPVTRQPICDADGAVAWVDLLAAGSSAARAQDRIVNDRIMKAKGLRYSSEQAESDLIDKLAKLTRGWRLLQLNGGDLDVDFSEGNARELYALAELAWLRDQVVEFVADLGNFQPAAVTN